ncbi:TPA: hypothetical protein RNT04_001683 [Stenotrophomonas maltophilia]|uniref:hypothetical protein n=1 Tax=Stenotrophomonas maltophilia group TaxID=995085 RepID=UPI00066A94CE|nr:hypothetical protein [Stenotrophomonas maltophilia]PZS72501.1 hypothetical protein A7X76_06630 [Stenotrophomonas maltophilia]HDX0789757.1 hypothetical protein [Stenotrophomonas maltophilia]HDX0805725.1 hypothetical protein [Stenotrophomonas maltophilia]HDX0817927.1 hypothetical protein [Stenotrophomonas maltophilia]HDX0831294.1 hypothetical protein [Stenotrophomonas maltophilia]
MSKLTKPFRGVRDGEIYPTDFAVGDECPPELEAGARALGALSEGKSSAESESDEKPVLIAKLEAAGIPFDKRWGAEKLAAALAEGKKD